MCPMPLPPGFKPLTDTIGPAPSPSNRNLPQPKPVNPKAVVKDTRMPLEETQFIFDTTLLPQHREDPNVIRFISHYLVCRDVPQAAREAGLTTRDGRVLKARRDIHECIVKVTDAAVLKHGYDAGEVVARVKEIGMFDPLEMQRPDGSFKNKMSEIAPEMRRAIKSMKVKNTYSKDPNGMDVIDGEIIEIQFWDKLKAIELLGREKDIFKETKKVEHGLSKNMSQVLLDSRRRAEEASASMRDVGEQVQLESKTVGEILDVGTDEDL
jgi:hypothetical protein